MGNGMGFLITAQIEISLPSLKLTAKAPENGWDWKMYFLLKMMTIHCYVRKYQRVVHVIPGGKSTAHMEFSIPITWGLLVLGFIINCPDVWEPPKKPSTSGDVWRFKNHSLTGYAQTNRNFVTSLVEVFTKLSGSQGADQMCIFGSEYLVGI